MNTRDVIVTYFDCVNTGRWDEYVALFADDVIMDEQLAGRLVGSEQVRRGIEGLRRAPAFRNELVDMVVEGDTGMARWHITADFGGGKTVDARGVNYYRVKEGKIAYFANYHDTRPFDVLRGRSPR